MFKTEYIFVGLIVISCTIFIIRKLKHPENFSCPGCKGCSRAADCHLAGETTDNNQPHSENSCPLSGSADNKTTDYRS